jgi:hypothetical protein
VLAVGVQIAREDARLVARLQHHCACAVAEQDAGGAIVEIENAREHFGPDHECAACAPGLDQRVGNRQRVDEAAAHGLHIEGRAARDAQLVLQDGRRGRKHHVGRRGGDDDQVHVAGLAARRLERTNRRLEREVAAGHVRRREMARADAGALDDPLVGRFDAPLGEFPSQLIVGDPARWQIAAGASDARKECHQTWSDAASAGTADEGRARSGAAWAMRARTRSSRLLRAAS